MTYSRFFRRSLRRCSFERLEARIALAADFLDPETNVISKGRIVTIPLEPAEIVMQDKLFYESISSARISGVDSPAFAPLEDTFLLHSRPSATKTIFIDFDGNTTVGTSWNYANGVPTIVSPAYDPDGNGAPFTSNELLRIQRIWQRVAEDFAPFDVNVTTQDPGQAALVKSGGSDTQWGIRAVVTINNFYPNSAGGVAYIDSFNWNLESTGATDTPIWVFNTSEIGVSAAVSHEAGHALGLWHDGTTASNPVQPSAEYYNGHGTGETSWGPIMGSGYYSNVTTWDQGEYFGSSNSGSGANNGRGASDIAIISTYNGFGLRFDDHGGTRATGTTVNYDTPDAATGLVGVSLFGVVGTPTDVDFAKFETGSGVVNITIDPYVSEIWRSNGGTSYSRSVEGTYFNSSSWQNNQGSNLDVEAKLYNDSGTLIATSNPTGLRATFANVSLSAGTYYISIDGVGFGNPASSTAPTGYTNFGSLGQYLVSGTVVAPGLQIRSVAASADKPEGNIGTTPFEFNIAISEVQTSAVTVDWIVSGIGSNSADASDFGGSFPSGTATIPAGQLTAPVVFDVTGDIDFESDEGFVLTLSNPTAGSIVLGDQGIIRNDDRAPIFLVDDDQNSNLEVFYQNALNANKNHFETWDVSVSSIPDVSVLNQYDAVIWYTGYVYSGNGAGLSSPEQVAIAAYLDAGGRLFLSGQDILYNGVATTFQQSYLKVASFTNDVLTTSHTENGIPGNLISDGLSLSVASPPGFGPLYVDGLSPTLDASGMLQLPAANANPYTSINYRGDYSRGGFGIVFMTAPFEAISTTVASPNNQNTVMQRVIEFLLPPPVLNIPPVVTVDALEVYGDKGVPITNSGSWSDVDIPANTVSLSASIGSVTKNIDGTWTWIFIPANEVAATEVVITANDGVGGESSASFTFAAANVAPVISVSNPIVAGNVLTEISNQGTWYDVAADNVELTASIGSVSRMANGTWSWSITPDTKEGDADVVITASDGTNSSTVSFKYSAFVNITNRQVFYNGSQFASGGANVAAAPDPNKEIAQEGSQPQTLSFANLINTTRGINGLVLDVAGLVATTLSPLDFEFRMSPQGLFDEASPPPGSWVAAPLPSNIIVSAGTSTAPARVRLEWPDNVIRNRWLQLSVIANTNTGLASKQVYYLGHLQGEMNGQLISNAYFVSNSDLTMVAPLGGGVMPVSELRDVNKDRFVSNADGIAIRNTVVSGFKLRNITIPSTGGVSEGAAGIAVTTFQSFAIAMLTMAEIKIQGDSFVADTGVFGQRNRMSVVYPSRDVTANSPDSVLKSSVVETAQSTSKGVERNRKLVLEQSSDLYFAEFGVAILF